jgi:hypothetical protein
MRFTAIALLALAGCVPEEPKTVAADEALSSITRSLAAFPTGFEMDDVTGDERLLFTAVPPSVSTAPTVLAARRLSGEPAGELPPPPGGWLFPAGAEVLSYETCGLATRGHLLVVDNAGVPPLTYPMLYDYAYSFSPAAGFSASLAATHHLPQLTVAPPSLPDGLGYVSGILALGADTLLTDALTGSIWVCDAAFSCRLGIIDADFGPGPAPIFTGTGRAPGGGTRPYTLQLPTPIMPGIIDVAHVELTDEVCTARAAVPGGIWCVDRALLLDASVPPYAKPKRVVVPPTPGVTDGQHGVAHDRWHPASPWLYWVRSLDNTVRRVNVQTLAVQVVAHSDSLMDFSTGLAVLPPLYAGSPLTNLAVAMGQEENNGGLNEVLGGADDFVAPSIIAGISLPAL